MYVKWKITQRNDYAHYADTSKSMRLKNVLQKYNMKYKTKTEIKLWL